MGSFSPLHWLIVLVVVILIFGTKKLKNVGQDLGSAIRGFKDSMNKAASDEKPQELTEKTGQTIEGEVKEKSNS
jgi:sec-independent protein translocase protein TatA